MPENVVRLKVGNDIYEGWTSSRVEQSILNISGKFTFLINGSDYLAPINSQGRCQVEMDGHDILNGWIDAIPLEYGPDTWNIRIEGRDVTGDLVDCSYVNPGKTSWSGVTVDKIIRDYCAPFGIEVVVDAPVGQQVRKYRHPDGDTVFAGISRLCRARGILPITTGDGKLLLTRAGSRRASDSIVLGENAISASQPNENKERFRDYYVKSQAESQGGTMVGGGELKAEDYTLAKGSVRDPLIQRFRPYQINADMGLTSGQCRQRANWEARTRAGRSRRATYVVENWYQLNGDPWELNSLVYVLDQRAGIDGTLLITDLARTQDEGLDGSRTEITVMDPRAFEQQPDVDIETEIPKISNGLDDLYGGLLAGLLAGLPTDTGE